MRILLVEDDTSSREALVELLELAGHGVVAAENGKDALDRLASDNRFGVILLDLMMPVMNGYEFRDHQLHDPRLASIPVIVVTANGRARQAAAQMHVDRYLSKPIVPLELLRVIGEVHPEDPKATA